MKSLLLILCVLAFAIAQVSAAEMPSTPPSPRTCELKTSYPTNPVDQYTFTWGRNDPSEGVTQYKLTYCKSGGSPTDVSCDRFLDKGSVYYWKVCAYSPEGGWGPADTVDQEKYTVTNIPPAPRTLTVVSYSGSSKFDTYRFTWGRNNDPGVSQYRIRYTYSDGSVFQYTVNQPASGNPHLDVLLTKANIISWKVAACSPGGWSAYGTDTQTPGETTSYTKPGMPENLEVYNYGDNGYDIAWDQNQYDYNPVTYEVWYAAEGSSTYYNSYSGSNEWHTWAEVTVSCRWSKILIKVRARFHGLSSDYSSKWLQLRAPEPARGPVGEYLYHCTPDMSYGIGFGGGENSELAWGKDSTGKYCTYIVVGDPNKDSKYHRWGYATYCTTTGRRHRSYTYYNGKDYILIYYDPAYCDIDSNGNAWIRIGFRNDWQSNWYPEYSTYGYMTDWLNLGHPPDD